MENWSKEEVLDTGLIKPRSQKRERITVFTKTDSSSSFVPEVKLHVV